LKKDCKKYILEYFNIFFNLHVPQYIPQSPHQPEGEIESKSTKKEKNHPGFRRFAFTLILQSQLEIKRIGSRERMVFGFHMKMHASFFYKFIIFFQLVEKTLGLNFKLKILILIAKKLETRTYEAYATTTSNCTLINEEVIPQYRP
jgi:hypothetical protein